LPLKLITETREIWNLDKKFLAKILKFAQFNTQFNSQIIKKNTASTAYLATTDDRKSAL